MNLTNDYLERLAATDNRTVYSGETVRGMAAELLQLRSLRDAGDEEVERLRDDAGCEEMYEDRSKALDTLRDIAIARGQTRTDAVNKAAEWAKECEQLQEEIERLKAKLEHKSQQVDSQVSLVSEMQAEIDSLTAELAELRKAPAMEEVDVLSGDFTTEECGQPCLTIWMQRNEKLADIAYLAIFAREVEKKRANSWQDRYEDENSERLIVEKERDEVVRLLKEAKKYSLLGEMEHMALFKGDEPSVVVRVSKRILEIVEWK